LGRTSDRVDRTLYVRLTTYRRNWRSWNGFQSQKKARWRNWPTGENKPYKNSSVLLIIVSDTDESETGIYIQFPLPDERLFRNQAIEDILLLFVQNPHSKFTVTEIREITGHGGDTIQTALTVLENADLIQPSHEGRKKILSANRDRFYNPDNPLLSIAQEQFRDPDKAFLDRLEQTETSVVGVILFGSVARGEADRASDIDIQIVVDDDPVTARRELQSVRKQVEEQKFDGDRYEIQLLVESTESAKNYGEKLQEIFSEGITLYSTPRLDAVKETVFDG